LRHCGCDDVSGKEEDIENEKAETDLENSENDHLQGNESVK
jgi:hypothetical protein